MIETKVSSAPWLQVVAANKRNTTVGKLDAAMNKMEEEIEENQMLYPYNGGVINQAEVCRRAGIKKGTLQGPTHKGTTKVIVDDWVNEVNGRIIKGKPRIQKAITERVDDAECRFKAIQLAYQKDHLKLEDAIARLKKCEAENEALRKIIAKTSGTNVYAFPLPPSVK